MDTNTLSLEILNLVNTLELTTGSLWGEINERQETAFFEAVSQNDILQLKFIRNQLTRSIDNARELAES